MSRAIKSVALVAILLVSAIPVVAQPGPEHRKLDFLVGKWRTDVDVKATAVSAASKGSGTEECEWFANLHIVCRGELTGPAGLYRSMRVISYIPTMKQYSTYSVDSLGYAVLSMGQVQGSTWSFNSNTGGFKTRYVMKGGKSSFSAVADYEGPDGKWVTMSTSKATRLK